MDLNTIATEVIKAMQAMSGWEVLAVVLALAYLALAIRENIACWYAAFASTAIYTFLFFDVSLLMESALQLYYLAMAVYGWWQWRHHPDRQEDLTIHTWSASQHLLAIATTAALASISGYLLTENTSAAMPYVDSLVTWASVIATVMVARKVLENWIYWVVIDTVSIFIYINRSLYLTAILFVLYVVMAIYGYLQWRRHYNEQASPCPKPA